MPTKTTQISRESSSELELPAEAIIPPCLVVSAKTGERLAELMENPRKPTPAMRALFAKK